MREDRNNKGAPYVDDLIFKNVPEVGTRIAALETGEINVLGLSRESVPRFQDDPNFKVFQTENTASINFVEFNYKRPPFDDPAFRRAFGAAIDVESILAGAYGGFGSLNYNPYPNGNPGWDPAIGEQYGMHYDPKAEFDFDIMRWTWNEPVILSLLFKCPGWKELFCDPKLDEMLTAADTDMNPATRLEKVKALQQYILEQGIIVPMVSDWYITASAANVNDLRYDATFGLTYDDVWVDQ